METTALRLCLQSICQNSPWIYAVFWKLRHEPHLFLTWEDGYFNVQRPKECMRSITEDAYSESFDRFLSSTCDLSTCIFSLSGPSIGPAVTEMSTISYAIGQGVVGEVAYNGVPQWVFSDKIANDRFNPSLASQWADEWLPQIEAGIKTILLIPSVPDGVLQLGSFETVAEDAQLVSNIKDKFTSDYKFVEYPSSFWLPVGIQHQSPTMMSMLVENFDQPSVNLGSNVGEDPTAVDSFSKGDQLSNTNNTSCIIPASHHILDHNMSKVDVFETGCEGDIHLVNMIGSAGRLTYQPSEQNISETKKRKLDRSLNLLEIEVDSSFNNNNARGLWDYGNETIDFYLDGGKMEPPLGIDCDTVINQSEGRFLSFPRDCELHKALGPGIVEGRTQFMFGSSDSQVAASSLVYNGDFNHRLLSPYSDGLFLQVDDEDNLLKTVVTNASEIPDYGSLNLFLNASALKHPRGSFFSESEGPNRPQSGNLLGEDSVTWSCVTSAEGHGNTPSNFSPSRTSYDHRITVPTTDQSQEKGNSFLNHMKKANVVTTNKRRVRRGEHRKPRPRDRQLIQERIKELRELVPNGAECSIDGLLDKTIKHMVFLQSITNRADKLGQQVVMEVSERTRAEPPETKNNGTSWAVDLASEKQMCPIIVKDLESPGQMLIEMLCYDYGRFLEIADVIHRLKLTILRGVMDKSSGDTWAHFVVEATGNFHRLDLFWPLMQVLQQNQLPVPSKI